MNLFDVNLGMHFDKKRKKSIITSDIILLHCTSGQKHAVITVTVQMQSRVQYPQALLFSLFHRTILSACVCCLFYKTNKDKQSWNSD